MDRTRKYYEACNNICTALKEMEMWTDAMGSAIEALGMVNGAERANLARYIESEINTVGNNFSDLRKRFMGKLGDVDDDDSEDDDIVGD